MKKHIAVLFLLNILIVIQAVLSLEAPGIRSVASDLSSLPIEKAVSGQPDDKFNLYWGDVHGHTGYSDGKGTVADYFRYARDMAKLDFVIVTDHDFGHEAPWRMPQEHWKIIQSQADEFTVNGRFVAVMGYEWTSQSKYWSEYTNNASENLFSGPPKNYNHKNVYFLNPVDYLFGANEAVYRTPELLAEAVSRVGGLIHNNHPSADPESRDQFDYASTWSSVIANTEMLADTLYYRGKAYQVRGEEVIRGFLNRGGRTGFVAGTDTHEGKPSARTAVLAEALTREAIFDALRHRRNYAVSGPRIGLDFRINGHRMGEDIEITGIPKITVSVHGTEQLAKVDLVRNGVLIHQVVSEQNDVTFEWSDVTFSGEAWYYLRVTQVDSDEHGNPSRAWSSPIWVRR